MVTGKAGLVFYEIALKSASMRNENCIVYFNSKANRTELCKKLKMSPASFMAHLATLVEAKIIKKDSRGHYELDFEIATDLISITK